MRKRIAKVRFRRRRESLTNYRKRVAMVKSGLERVVVRRSNRRIIGQVIKYEAKGDVALAYADSQELKKFGWPSRGNKPTAYLTGLLLARKAGQRGECILDIGLSSPVKNSIPFVFAKGCKDGGLRLKGNFEIDENVYNYSNSKYAKELMEKNKSQFGEYARSGIAPEKLNALFNETKGKILKIEK